jgi:hypothetical protein
VGCKLVLWRRGPGDDTVDAKPPRGFIRQRFEQGVVVVVGPTGNGDFNGVVVVMLAFVGDISLATMT